MKILSIVDSFKGSLSSKEIANIIKSHYKHSQHHIRTMRISDGGEGFLEAIGHHTHSKKIYVDTVGPLGNPLNAYYLLDQKTAFIELNQAVGINQIKKHELNPLKTSTYGLGILIKHAIETKNAKKIILGIGGSATNDGGAGMLQAMGLKFYKNNQLITEHMNGKLIGSFDDINDDALNDLIRNVKFLIASDVNNPLLGDKGCCSMYAPQKGATKQMLVDLEEYMTTYALKIEKIKQKTFKDEHGAGAAGGVGFAAISFLNATILSGIDFMIKQLNIEKYIKQSDVVIVGEGKLDDQTNHGKAPFGIAKLAKSYDKKVIAICALYDGHNSSYMDKVYAIVPSIATKEESLKFPKESLIRLLESIKEIPC